MDVKMDKMEMEKINAKIEKMDATMEQLKGKKMKQKTTEEEALSRY